MSVLIVVLSAALLALGAVLVAAHLSRPIRLRVAVTASRWLRGEIEIEHPSPDAQTGPPPASK